MGVASGSKVRLDLAGDMTAAARAALPLVVVPVLCGGRGTGVAWLRGDMADCERAKRRERERQGVDQRELDMM